MKYRFNFLNSLPFVYLRKHTREERLVTPGPPDPAGRGGRRPGCDTLRGAGDSRPGYLAPGGQDSRRQPEEFIIAASDPHVPAVALPAAGHKTQALPAASGRHHLPCALGGNSRGLAAWLEEVGRARRGSPRRRKAGA